MFVIHESVDRPYPFGKHPHVAVLTCCLFVFVTLPPPLCFVIHPSLPVFPVSYLLHHKAPQRSPVHSKTTEHTK